MAADTAVATSVPEPLQDSHPSEKPASSEKASTTRKTYTTEQLHEIANLPRAKTCPSVLDLDNAKSTPWLLKIIAGAESPQIRLEPFTYSNEERARGLRPTSESDSGMSLLPQRSSFQTGCRPSLHLSPSKGKMGLLGMKPEPTGTFETLDRNRNLGDNTAPITRNGTREFFNSRLQSYNNNNNSRGYNNNNGYNNYNGDRYNSNGQRSYNNNRDGGFRRLDRNMDDRDTFDRNDGRGERNYDDPRNFGRDLDDGPLPEWAEDGPSSQNDYIELRGFDDDPADNSSSKDSESVDRKSETSTKDSSSVQSEATERPDPSDSKKKKSSVTGVDLPDLVIPPTEAAEASTRPPETEGKDGQSAGFGGKSRFAGLFGSSEARQPPQVAPKVASSSPPTPSSDIHLPSPNQPVLPMALASILAATPAQVSPAEQQAGRTLLSFIRKDDVTPPVSQGTLSGILNRPVVRQMRTLEDIEKEHRRQLVAEAAQPQQQQPQPKLPASMYPQNVSTVAPAGGQSRFFDAFGSEAPAAATQNGPAPMHRGMSFHGSLPHLSGVLDPSAVLARSVDPQLQARAVDPRTMDPRAMDPVIAMSVPVQIPGIPNDPNLHQLLQRSNEELVRWKESGLFDHATLLDLIRLKQQRQQHLTAISSGHASPLPFGNALGPAAQISGASASAGLIRPQFVQPGMQGLQQQQLQMTQNNRLPHINPAYGPRYPGDVLSHAQNGLFGQTVDPRQLQRLQNSQQMSDGLALLRLANAQQQQQLSEQSAMMAHQEQQMRMAALQQQQRQLAQASQPTNISRPSPLLPTSVLRRTVQRGEYGQASATAQSSMHHSASSPQFGLDQLQQQQQRHSLLTTDDQHQQRLFLAAQQQQQQQAAFSARSNQANPADQFNVSNMIRYSYAGYPQNAQAES